MSTQDLPRLFPLRGYGDDFVTGICADGRQVVMGLLCPHVVAYFFDPNGKLSGGERRPWKKPAPRIGGDGPYNIYDRGFQEALVEQMLEWQRQVSFCASTINVQAFFDDSFPVGITLLPDYLEQDQIAEAHKDRRNDLEELRANWITNGEFVWWWAKDYYMSKDGEVEST